MFNYNFKEGIYSSYIFYSEPIHVFSFFSENLQTREFFKYLFARIKEENKLRVKGVKNSTHVIENENDKFALVDINYNFFIEVLGDWIEHYSANKSNEVEYMKFRKTEVEEEGLKKDKLEYKNMKLELSTSENVKFDYSYSQWLSSAKGKKFIRYNLVQILFNGILGKHTFVPNYNNRYRATPVTVTLIKDENNNYFRFPSISFFKDILVKYLGKDNTKTLKSYGKNNEVIRRSPSGIKSQIEKRKLDEKDIKFLNVFDIYSIEKTRDLSNENWTVYEKKKEEEESDENEPKTEDFKA